MDIKNGIDVSSFLLVEEIADSEEFDYGLIELAPDMGMTGDGDDDDDAESCNCDHTGNFSEVLESDDQVLSYSDGNSHGEKQSDLSCRSCDAALMEFIVAENGEVESGFGSNTVGRKTLDNVEDKLFWEICLALGYP